MAERSIFDALVAELSADERKEILAQLRRTAPVSDEPLYAESALPRGEAADYASKVAGLGIFSRLIIFIRGLLSGKSGELILREDDLKLVARRIDERYPGLVDRKRGLLLGAFADELRHLRDSARFFYDVLDRSVERDRAAFFAFLASFELPELHERLLTGTDPYRLSLTITRPQEAEIRASLLSSYDQAFGVIPEAGRKAMYHDVRCLLFLKRLSCFLYERLIGVFREGLGSESAPAAPFAEIRELLCDLGDILFSMSSPPTVALMEALFVFVEREELGRPGADAEQVLGADILRAEAALGRIRAFNARLPFIDILRIVTGDPTYGPRALAGGEDWLALYKAFWRERIEGQLDDWKVERRYRELAEEVAAFVGDPGPGGFTRISREETEAAPPCRHEVSLAFLDAFYRGPFLRDLNRPFKVILVDGEFYRKDNRIEFTDAFNGLLRIPEALKFLDDRLGPEGEIGSAWIQARAEMGPAPLKRRKTQGIARGADEEAERILRRGASSLLTMVNVLRGLLKGEAGGRYDSLVNLSYIDGRGNKEFLRTLNQAKDRCERALGLLAELSGLDFDSED